MPGTIPSLPWWQREEERISRWNDSKPTGSKIKKEVKEKETKRELKWKIEKETEREG